MLEVVKSRIHQVSKVTIVELSRSLAYASGVARTRPASKATLAADVWRDLFSFFWSSGSRNTMIVASQELGVTPGHVKALLELEPGQARPMRALADSLHCDASNATWLVDRLEEQGLVERGSVPTDRRVKTVVLTPLGVKTRDSVIERLHEPPEDLLALDREDLEELRAALAKLPKSELPFGA
jgi:DNA-binding MarR family transcriptional regulator